MTGGLFFVRLKLLFGESVKIYGKQPDTEDNFIYAKFR